MKVDQVNSAGGGGPPADHRVRATRLRRWLVPANLIPLGAFLVGFLALPVRALGGFANIPGNMGDSRLNGYFLENIYQFLTGGSPSLWNLGMFAPYPYVLGFSDNLFGAFPAYLVPRVITGDTSLSMVVWWYIGWIVNFLAAYVALRKLSLKRIGATVGALVFTFALPMANYSFNWVQLDYRFGLPLAVAAWVLFLRHKSWTQLVVAAGWTVWQFYCTIYVGVFTLTLLLCITVAHFVVALFTSRLKGLGKGAKEYWTELVNLGRRRLAWLGAALVSLAAAMVALMWPYLQVTRIYGFVRSYSEILLMLPTARSYLVSDESWIWAGFSAHFTSSLVPYEHQNFLGAVVIVLALIGVVAGVRRHVDRTFAMILLGLLGVALLTFVSHDVSLWQFMARLPLFSAIRAVGRIIVAMLFLVGYLAGYGADTLVTKGKAARAILAVLVVALVVEFACVSPMTAPRAEWQSYDASTDASIPKDLPADAILFFAQKDVIWYASEINAIWGALRADRPTINGYSGGSPKGYNTYYGTACAELPHRVLAYLSFTGKTGDTAAYRALMARVVPIGFTDCNPVWWTEPPTITTSTVDLTKDQLAAITLSNGSSSASANTPYAMVTVTNTMSTTLSAEGTHPVHIGWRFVDANGTPVTGWDAGRSTLPFDLKPGESVNVFLSLDPSLAVKGGSIQVTLIQEGLMRAVDAGIQPFSIQIND